MTGLWFEDLELGQRFLTAGRTVTEADVVNFAGISGDFNEIHTNAEIMRDSQFGTRIAHGALVLSIITGLRSQLGIFDGTIIAFAGIRDWRFVLPVRIGDTVRAVNIVSELTPSKKPDRGIVVQTVEVLNQAEEVVQRGEMVSLVRRRSGE